MSTLQAGGHRHVKLMLNTRFLLVVNASSSPDCRVAGFNKNLGCAGKNFHCLLPACKVYFWTRHLCKFFCFKQKAIVLRKTVHGGKLFSLDFRLSTFEYA